MAQKPRGRPALPKDEKLSAHVDVHMRDQLYDRAYQAASDARTSVPDLIREALRRHLTACSTR